MLAAYPERKMHKDEQEYGMVLSGDSATRFYEDYKQHRLAKSESKGR